MKTNMYLRSRLNSWIQSSIGAAVHLFLISVKYVLRCPDCSVLTGFLQLTNQFEGSLIRVFRRLGELLRQMAQATKVIGNEELTKKFGQASEMLERPNSVIFCSSLYL